jgi:hypothetical protein
LTRTPEEELTERLRGLIAPRRTDVLRGKRAVLAKFDDGNVHTDAALVDAVSDALEAPRELGSTEIQFQEPAAPELIEESTPAVQFLRARVAGMFAVAELANASIIMPAIPPPSTLERVGIRWLTEETVTVGINEPGRNGSVGVPIPRPALEQAYLRPGEGESWYRDPDLFLEDLSSLDLDERADRALRESLRAFNRGLYLAAASLLGVVSEAAWYAATAKLGPVGKLEEAVRQERTAQVQVLVAGILRERKAGAPTMPDELLANAALLRVLRNYGVHPVEQRDDLERYFNEEECGLLLLRTHNYLVRLSSAVDAALQGEP